MKISAENLKNLNYKQWAVDHGEKVVLGLIGLFMIIALVGTRWVPYQRKPQEMINNVTQSEENVSRGTWPEEEKQEYASVADVHKDVKKMLKPINPSLYELKDFFAPLFPTKEPLREPKWQAAVDTIADAGHVIIGVRPKDVYNLSEGLNGLVLNRDGRVDDVDEDDDLPDQFRAPSGRDQSFGDPGDRSLATLNSVLAAGRPKSPNAKRGRMVDDDMGTGHQDRANRIHSVDGKGRRYVAVRAVFPLNRQAREIEKALNLKKGGRINPIDLVHFVDFEIQRQTAVEGAKQWSDWKTLDIQVAFDVLSESLNFDLDEVDTAIIDQIITMPLPGRVVGIWGDHATHPLVKDYQLSDEEKDEEARINEKYREYIKKMKALRPEPVKQGGFGGHQYQMRRWRQRVNRNPNERKKLFYELGQEMDPRRQNRTRIDDIQSRVLAIGRLLLFRYIDFDVEPENAYRYRVRFELSNPNYQRVIADALYPEVVEGQTRLTPWSEPTAAVVVAPDAQYFVDRIDKASGRMETAAMLKVFQWYADVGTTIHEVLRTNYGQFIGGKTKTKLLNPAHETFDTEEVVFATPDVLVDMSESPRLKRDEHADLKLGPMIRGHIGLSEQILTVNPFGELVVHDPVTSNAAENQSETWLEQERRNWIYLNERSNEDDALAREYRGDTGKSKRLGRRKRKGNPIRKGRDRGRERARKNQINLPNT